MWNQVEKIYKMIPGQNFEPVQVEYTPYIEVRHKYCKDCGLPNKIDLEGEGTFSPITGNAIYSMFYCCDNGHHSESILSVYRWRKDGRLYTGNFEDPQDYIDRQLNKRSRHERK